MVGAVGSKISSWEEGARTPESQALKLQLRQRKPQTSTRFAPRFVSWLCRLSTQRLSGSCFSSFGLSFTFSEMGMIVGPASQGCCLD